MENKREIKFRAWDGKRMTASGVFFNSSTGTLEVPKSLSFADGELPEHLQYKLMQYTGLKDKNGKEIYEGDICERNGHYYEIGFRDGAFGVVRTKDTMTHIQNMFHGHALYNYISELVIKGNIYQNPELLK